jgi:hypothetical protein
VLLKAQCRVFKSSDRIILFPLQQSDNDGRAEYYSRAKTAEGVSEPQQQPQHTSEKEEPARWLKDLPRIVVPYQMEELAPILTLPMILALGATNAVTLTEGTWPS